MKRTIILAAVLAAATSAPLAGAALAADAADAADARVAPISAAADSGNTELVINVTGDRRSCGRWLYEWKVQGNTGSGKRWMRYCR